jgi:hypothetical protein
MAKTKSARKLPANAALFAAVARSLHLSCPLGRALYACNRVQNGGHPWGLMAHVLQGKYVAYSGAYAYSNQEVAQKMRSIRHTTAQRWLAHFLAGNSIKSLSHGKAGR